MPRKPTILQNEFPYGLTARSNNQEWFQTPLNECWKIFVDALDETSERYGVRTHSFVLMSNHFHWLVSTPNSNLGLAMRYFMTETSRRIARSSGRINKIYGSRYKSTVITDPGYYANTYRYFFQNPLRAGICRDVYNYEWSTFRSRSGIDVFPCAQLEEYIPTCPHELRNWLNAVPDTKFNECMKLALRRPEFWFPRNPETKRNLRSDSFLEI